MESETETKREREREEEMLLVKVWTTSYGGVVWCHTRATAADLEENRWKEHKRKKEGPETTETDRQL